MSTSPGRRCSVRTSPESGSTPSCRCAAATCSASTSLTGPSPGSTYTTLASTYVVMGITDAALALVFFAYALTLGVLPGISLLPDLRSFDFVWLLTHPRATGGILFALVVASTSFKSGYNPESTTSGVGSHRPSPFSARRRAISARSSPGSSPTGACGSPRSGSSSPPSASIRSARNVMLVQVTHSSPWLRSAWWDRNRAGVPGLRFRGRSRGSAARPQRRRPNHSHGGQRRGGAIALPLMLRTPATSSTWRLHHHLPGT